MRKINLEINPKLTHVIIVDAGQWSKGASLLEAKKVFKEMHSARKLKHSQVWAVTGSTYINEHGGFRCPRAEWIEPVRIN